MNNTLTQIEDLLKEAGVTRNVDPVKSLSLLSRALEMSRAEEDRLLEVKCLIGIALTHQTSSRFAESLETLGRALEISNAIDSPMAISDCYSGFGNTYFYLNDNDRALKYHLDGLKLREKGMDQSRIAFSINSVGVVYATMANFALAEEYFQRSLDMNTKLNNLFGIRMAMNNIGVASFEQKKYDKAIKILTAALPGSEGLLNDTIQTEILTNLGDAHRDNGDSSKAEEYLMQADTILKGRNNIAEARVMVSRARLQFSLNDFSKAKEFCNNAIGLYKTLKLNDPLSKAYKLLGEIEFKAGDATRAMVAIQQHMALNDLLHAEEMRKKTHNLTLIFEAENLRKEGEINFLKNVQLKKAYDEIGVINQNLTDSIQYAKNFQDVIFQKHILALQVRFPDSFVFSSPKDIVSGDFVWFHDRPEGAIIAVADCTGHGVPGAFLSMLGNDLLNKAVIEHKISYPERILEFLHGAIREYFPEKEIAPKQGMDILVIRLQKAGAISWSGARGQGFLFRDGEFPKELNGDKIFLGSMLSHEFSLWESRVEKGDRIFLYSDGMIDQKGRADHANSGLSRYGRERLIRELESKRASRTMVNELSKSFDTWKGQQKQVDDVMVAGIEFS